MGIKVSNLTIKPQPGGDQLYASWEFKGITTTSSSGVIKVGSLVSIKSGAKYYNGASIPNWVMAKKWYISQVNNNTGRAVLGKSEDGVDNIQSPINISNLILSGSSSTSTTVDKSTLDHYNVTWRYKTSDYFSFLGGSSEVASSERSFLFTPPDNAVNVSVAVTPVAKTHKVNDKDVSYWSGEAVSLFYWMYNYPPENISAPTVEIDKYTLKASYESITDARTDEISFEVYNGTKRVNTGTVKVVLGMASFSCSVVAGGSYKVRARAANLISDNTRIYSKWSEFTSSATTIPATPKEIIEIRATSETSVYLKWSTVETAKTYDIEYTKEKRYFDGSDETTPKTGIKNNYYEVTGLDSGDEYFFRVRAVNDNGESSWSDIKSVVIGKKPSAPTTWSSTTTAITGETLNLYWVHNSEDGSSQTRAELELTINGSTETHTITNSTDENEKDKTSSYSIDTSTYIEGTTIKWRVRTSGITNEYGDWSIQRTVDIYAPPTLELSITDVNNNELNTITSFPFYIKGLAGPSTQVPIGYHVTITSNQEYETTDYIGVNRIIKEGDSLYSKYFDTKESLLVEMYAGNVDLENNMEYTVNCTVSMDSGLTADSSLIFNVSWTDNTYTPTAEIGIDEESLTAYIRPYCRDDDGNMIDGISLSVYRREFDGTFTELATGIDNNRNTMILDPHPALDYARYRIVATTNSTGAIGFYDMPSYPIQCKSLVIQWDEDWTDFSTTNPDPMAIQPWTGSMIKLPYNVDVSESTSTDVSFVEYIGRSNPISYYGTQIGESGSWNAEIEKTDTDTIYALRRLSKWMGDVYVREPSGVGYWANVSVSFSQKHLSMTIPVSLSITRVEGGI